MWEILCRLTDRHRGQARLPQVLCVPHVFDTTHNLWEPGLPRAAFRRLNDNAD